MDKSPITLQSIILDFWKSCAEVMGRVDVTIPDPAMSPLSEVIPMMPETHEVPRAVGQEMLEEMTFAVVDEMDRSEVGAELKKFDQLTGQTFTHSLEASEDTLLGHMHKNEVLQKKLGAQTPSAPVLPAPVPLAQLSHEAALRFAQGAGFAQMAHDELSQKSEDEKTEDEENSLSEEKVKKLIRLGRLKSF